MKRILAMMLVIVMVFSLASCGSSDNGKKDSGKKDDKEQIKVSDSDDIRIVDKPGDDPVSQPSGGKDIPVISGSWADSSWTYQLYLYDDGSYTYYTPNPNGDGTQSEEGSYLFDGYKLECLPFLDVDSLAPVLYYNESNGNLEDNAGTVFTRVGDAEQYDDPDYDPDYDPVNEPIGEDDYETPETIGYFNYYGIYPNVEAGSRTSFPKGGCYVSENTDGYYITNPDVEVKITEYSQDDGYGYGHMKVNMSIFFKNDLPADFGQSSIVDFWELYDTFSGDVISPDASVDSPDNTWTNEFIAARPDGSYDVKVIQSFSYERRKDGYLMSFYNTLTIIFPTGYSGVSLVLFPAPKNRKAYKSNKKQDRLIKLMDRKYTTLEGAFIYGLF